MIDARDYKTHDELADAMQLERDVSELEYLTKQLAKLELSFEFYKSQHEHAIAEIKARQLELQNNIHQLHKKIWLDIKRNSMNDEKRESLNLSGAPIESEIL